MVDMDVDHPSELPEDHPVRLNRSMSNEHGHPVQMVAEHTDMACIAELAKYGGGPLTDIASFIFCGGKDTPPELGSLALLVPTLGNDIQEVNPYLSAAWKSYIEEFDYDLLKPNKLWVLTLSEEEKEAVAPAQALYDAKDFWAYVQAIWELPEGIKAKIKPFKKRVFRSLVDYGCTEGPVCDVLIYLSEWLSDPANPHHHALEVVEGPWVVNKDKGITSVSLDEPAEEGGATVRSPRLKNPTNSTAVVQSMGRELRRLILNGVALSPPLYQSATWSVSEGRWLVQNHYT